MGKKSKILKGTIVVSVVAISVMLISFISYISKAKKQLAQIDDKVQTVQTSYGTMSYIDEGEGETLLVCHGIFGGYDQGYNSFKELSNQYRILAPSRFGYIGTEFPKRAAVLDQAKAYEELLDELNSDKIYVVGTSAGGVCALRFALEYPERVKGVILYCSNAVLAKKPDEDEIAKYLGPPKVVCNDFMMWLAGPVMKKVMNMTSETWLTVFPVSERAKGAINDGYEANLDADKNYDHYTLEKMETPVLILHAKDDQMASYKKIEAMVPRFSNVTFISFEEGGHMMTGNEEEVKKALVNFISKTK